MSRGHEFDTSNPFDRINPLAGIGRVIFHHEENKAAGDSPPSLTGSVSAANVEDEPKRDVEREKLESGWGADGGPGHDS